MISRTPAFTILFLLAVAHAGGAVAAAPRSTVPRAATPDAVHRSAGTNGGAGGGANGDANRSRAAEIARARRARKAARRNARPPRGAALVGKQALARAGRPMSDSERFMLHGEGDPVTRVTGKGAAKRAVIWLHGASHRTDNSLFVRLAEALDAEGVDLVLHSVPWQSLAGLQTIRAILDRYPAVTLVGHSAGTSAANELVARFPGKIDGLVLINGALPDPRFVAAGGKALVITAEHDYLLGPARVEAARRAERDGFDFYVQAAAEHSLRYAPDGPSLSEAQKAAMNAAPESRQIAIDVARRMGAFFDAARAAPARAADRPVGGEGPRAADPSPGDEGPRADPPAGREGPRGADPIERGAPRAGD